MDQKLLNRLTSQLNTIHNPQINLVKQQQAALPAQFDLVKQGIEQAKSNAFRDISSKARGMGVAFGGYSPSEQARYTGATYLPALADLQGKQTAAASFLQDALNQIYANRATQAYGLYNTIQDRNQAQKQWQAEMDYKAKQDALDRAAAVSASRSSGGSSSSSASTSPDLAAMFAGYNPKKDKWYTENVVIPTLISQYGYSAAKAKSQAYAYRKLAFGE